MREADGQRGERLGDRVAVLVDAVALDLLGTRPDVRIVVVAVLRDREPVVVFVDPGRRAYGAAAATTATATATATGVGGDVDRRRRRVGRDAGRAGREGK